MRVVFLVFLLFCYFYVKGLVMKALRLSLSLSIFPVVIVFLVFGIKLKWIISYTDLD